MKPSPHKQNSRNLIHFFVSTKILSLLLRCSDRHMLKLIFEDSMSRQNSRQPLIPISILLCLENKINNYLFVEIFKTFSHISSNSQHVYYHVPRAYDNSLKLPFLYIFLPFHSNFFNLFKQTNFKCLLRSSKNWFFWKYTKKKSVDVYFMNNNTLSFITVIPIV